MFQTAFNCKKCPSTEQVTVCPNGQDSVANLVQKNESKETQFQATGKAQPVSVFGNVATKHSNSDFFAQQEDDRSTLHSLNVHPIAKVAILALLFMHSLSETPGLGSNGPSLSQFVISGHELAGQHSGLKLS